MNEEIVWEEPNRRDGRGKPRKDWANIASQLRASPGNWALIDTDVAASSAAQIRAGKNKAFPEGEFEVTVRGTDRSGRAEKLFARYIGTEASS